MTDADDAVRRSEVLNLLPAISADTPAGYVAALRVAITALPASPPPSRASERVLAKCGLCEENYVAAYPGAMHQACLHNASGGQPSPSNLSPPSGEREAIAAFREIELLAKTAFDDHAISADSARPIHHIRYVAQQALIQLVGFDAAILTPPSPERTAALEKALDAFGYAEFCGTKQEIATARALVIRLAQGGV